MNRIVIFADTVHDSLALRLTKAGFICIDASGLDLNKVRSECRNAEGLIIRSRFPVDREFLNNCPSLKWIGRFGAGMENIDTAYAQTKGIVCLHAAEGNRDSVAEHALGMLLALLNNITRADREVRKGLWQREANRGVELMGKTVGIIGYGNMGSAFAERLSGFGVRILAYDKYKNGFAARLNRVEECSFEKLAKESDVISLHIPLSSETNQMVNDSWIQNIHKPFYLINTSRGACVSTQAVKNGLISGKILGACLDVLELEDSSFENPEMKFKSEPMLSLLQDDRVIFSPHIAGWSHQSNEKLASVLAEKIINITGTHEF